MERDVVKKHLKNELSSNNNWDNLQTRYQECRELMLVHLGVANVLENPEVQAEVRANGTEATLVSNIQLLTRDVRERVNELEMIYGVHRDKHGSADENDIMLSFEVMEKYTQWLALIEAVLMPTMAHILEITAEAEKAVALKNAATDPNDARPIDVEFKEATPSGQYGEALNAELAKADHTNPQPE